MVSYRTQAEIPALESYGKLEQVSDISISPNGELIAYRLTESDEKDFIVVLSLKTRKVVAGLDVKKIDPQGHYFANDDYLVLIGSNHVKLRNYRNSFDASTAFSFDIKTKKVEQLVKLGEKASGKIVIAGQTGLGDVVGKTPDGTTLFIPAFVAKRELDTNPNFSLLSVNVSGKGRPKIAVEGTRNTRDFFMDDQGNVVAREHLDNRTNVHSIQVQVKRRWRTLYEYESEIPTHNFIGLNNDFSGLIFARDDDEKGYLLLSLEDGSVKELDDLVLTRDASGLIRNDHNVVLGLKYAGFRPDYHLLDKDLNQRLKSIVAQYGANSVHLVDWTSDWRHIVVRVEGSSYVGDYFLYSEGEKPTLISSARPDIPYQQINPIVESEYEARDGLKIPTLLTFPVTKLDKLENLPTVILPHGGPESQDRLGFDYMAQAFSSKGFLVIQPQFRGSEGFGLELLEAGVGQWGKGMQDDLIDAITAFTKEGFVDPSKVCIVGASYGGYAALAGAAFTPDMYQCAVSINGVSHLPQMFKDEKREHGKSSWVLDYWEKNILDGDYDKQLLKDVSPYYAAQNIKAPVLLLHGEDDRVVFFNQSKLMQKAIKKHKGDVTLIKLKKDDHHLGDAKTRIQAVTEMVTFVEKHIGN